MPKTTPISSSFKIPTDLNAITSFYTKQPLLAIATTIVLPILGIVGLLYLRMKSDPSEEESKEFIEKFTAQEEISEFTNPEKFNLENALALQKVDETSGNRLLDRLSFYALKAGDLNLAWQSSIRIHDNPDMRVYAICRMFNHLFNLERKLEENYDMQLLHIANACVENDQIQLVLNKKIFIRFLQENKHELAYNYFLRDRVLLSDVTDHLSIKLFEACVEKNDQLFAQKAVDKISDLKRAVYVQRYQEKWGTS